MSCTTMTGVIRTTLSISALCLVGRAASAIPADGSIAWSLPQPGAASLFPPALGPGGVIYTSNGGAVTAVAPDGAVLWSVSTDGAAGPVAVGLDGTIHVATGPVGANPTILALHPDGSERWTFDAGASIHAGPNVGPDGRIYAVADTETGGVGFFALDADGDLLWSDEGDPALSADTGQPHEIVFGPNRAYVAMATQGAGGGGGQPAGLWAFDLDAADQAFALMGSCQGQPVVSPLTGHLVTGNGICQEVQTYDPVDGGLLWSEEAPSQSPCSGLSNIAMGPDGSIYTSFCHRAFWSLTADGTRRWFDDDFGFYFQMNRLAVVPDGSVVLDLGGEVGAPGWIRAFSAGTAALLWQLDLDLVSQKASSRPVFDVESGRAYVNVNRFGAGASDLIAIDLGASGSPCGADLDGDGVVGGADLGLLLGAWGSVSSDADLDGDGTVGGADLGLLLGAWGACT